MVKLKFIVSKCFIIKSNNKKVKKEKNHQESTSLPVNIKLTLIEVFAERN